MNRFELKIPPAVLAAVTMLVMWGLSRLFPNLGFRHPWLWWAAVGLGAAGAVVLLAGAASAARAGTTVDPRRPESASALVTSGVFRFSRNPMYLGMLLVIAAWGVRLANLASLLLVPVFAALISRLQILPEERILRARFGRDYENYCRRVRRWI